MFAVVTAVGRTVGWGGALDEMHQAPLTIYRPRQIYVGEGYRDYVSRRGERSAELGNALQAGGARRLPAQAGYYSEMPGEQIVLDGGISRLTGCTAPTGR